MFKLRGYSLHAFLHVAFRSRGRRLHAHDVLNRPRAIAFSFSIKPLALHVRKTHCPACERQTLNKSSGKACRNCARWSELSFTGATMCGDRTMASVLMPSFYWAPWDGSAAFLKEATSCVCVQSHKCAGRPGTFALHMIENVFL